jgi:protein phosphatase
MKDQPDPQQCADGLGQLALDKGSRDNISCIVVDVTESK